MKQKLILLSLIISLFSVLPARAEKFSISETFITESIQVEGVAGRPWELVASPLQEEQERAWMDASHHAYEALLKLPFGDGKKVSDCLFVNPSLKKRLGMLLKAAEKDFYTEELSGLVKCKLRVELSGPVSLRSALYLDALKLGAAKASDIFFRKDRETGEKIKKSPYSQLVIDMRKTSFEPSLFPKFLNEKGFLLFQEAMIVSPARFSRPAVVYRTEMPDFTSGNVFFAETSFDSKHPHDIIVKYQDLNEFVLFAGDLEENLLSDKTIVVLIDKIDSLKHVNSGRLQKTSKQK